MSDLFPAVVAVYDADFLVGKEKPYSIIGLSDSPASSFNDCRVIVHKNYLIVGADSARGGTLVFKEGILEIFKEGVYTRVLTESGKLVVFAKSKGCGCGSRLRSWNPYGSVVSSRNV